MERANDDTSEESVANNNAGRNLKVEALTTVRQLERFLAKSVARQWYDMERSTYHFVQKIKAEAPLNFTYDVRFIQFFFGLLEINVKKCNKVINLFSCSMILMKMASCILLEAMVGLVNG